MRARTFLSQAESGSFVSGPFYEVCAELASLQRVGEQTELLKVRNTMAFIQRLVMHYGIYRRYPLAHLPAIKSAWRISR